MQVDCNLQMLVLLSSVCLFFLVNKQFLQVLMIYLTLKCTLAHSTILKSRLELNFVGGTFFFFTVSGWTN